MTARTEVCGPTPRKNDYFNSGRLRSFLRGGRFVRNLKSVSYFAGKESEESVSGLRAV